MRGRKKKEQTEVEVDLVSVSGLDQSEFDLLAEDFDPKFYIKLYPDVRKAGVDPIEHYVRFGATEGRLPNKDYNPNNYMNRVGDINKTGLLLYVDYIRAKQDEGRRYPQNLESLREDIEEHFDSALYLRLYKDVARTGSDPLTHYLNLGALEDRVPSASFDPSYYKAHYPDVRRPGAYAFWHYIYIGSKEERKASSDAWETSSIEAEHSGRKLSDIYDFEKDGLGVRGLRKKALHDDFFLFEHQTIEPHFDEEFYIRRYPDIATASINPLVHFIIHGAKEGRNPNANFDSKFYRSRYPDVEKSGSNPFLHYLLIGRAEGRACSPLSSGQETFDTISCELGLEPKVAADKDEVRRADMRERLENGTLSKMFSMASELDPLISHSRLDSMRVGFPPFRSAELMLQIQSMIGLQANAHWSKSKIVVLIPWNHLGGASRVAGMLTKALTEHLGVSEVVVVQTESSEFDYPQWFPEGYRHIYFSEHKSADREMLLFQFLRSMCPDAIINVNSGIFWPMIERFGPALAEHSRLYSYLFCNEKNIYGDWVGYPIRHFHKIIELFSGVFLDSEFLHEELSERFILPKTCENKLTVLRSPMPQSFDVPHNRKMSTYKRKQVFWAGRFDRQKRIDLVYKIAEKMPDVDFLVWGEAKLDKKFARLTRPSNIILQGVYSEFSELPLEDCDAWLYTSEWDGVPTILLDVVAAGIPVVGSIAGGTSEIFQGRANLGVKDIDDIDRYIELLNSVFENPVKAKSKAASLRRKLEKQRNWSSFKADLILATELS